MHSDPVDKVEELGEKYLCTDEDKDSYFKTSIHRPASL